MIRKVAITAALMMPIIIAGSANVKAASICEHWIVVNSPKIHHTIKTIKAWNAWVKTPKGKVWSEKHPNGVPLSRKAILKKISFACSNDSISTIEPTLDTIIANNTENLSIPVISTMDDSDIGSIPDNAIFPREDIPTNTSGTESDDYSYSTYPIVLGGFGGTSPVGPSGPSIPIGPITNTPEPGSIFLFATGLFGIAFLIKNKVVV